MNSRYLKDIDITECHFPTDSGSPMRFCGAPVQSGSPYCKTHHALCHDQRRQVTEEWIEKMFQSVTNLQQRNDEKDLPSDIDFK